MRLFLIIVVFSLISLTGKTQNFQGGLSIGANASQVDGDFSSGFNQIGIRAGAFATYQISNGFALQGQLLFDQLGSADGNRGGLIVRTNYFSFPILSQFSLPIILGEETQDLILQLGPSIGVLLNAKDQTGEFTGLNELDIRLLAGIEFPLGNNALSLLYGYSMNSLAGNSTGNPIIQANARGLFHNHVALSLNLSLY